MPNQEAAKLQESKQEPAKDATASSTSSLPSSLKPPSSAAAAFTSSASVRSNWLIHALYLQQDFTACLRVIDSVMDECDGQCEYAIYVKGLIRRQQGSISQSLSLFQQATLLSPHHTANLKQVGRSLFLMGKHRQACEVYAEAQRIGIDDWEVWLNRGLCLLQLKRLPEALDCFQQSSALCRHESTFVAMSKVYTAQEKYEQAIEVLLEALEHSPAQPELLTTVGLLYLRLGQNYRAFDYLGSSLQQDPRNPKSILAAGSIIQDHSDMEQALSKYRIAAVLTPSSAQLWNNIGMCMHGRQRLIAAIACLKRALYLDPFEWIISYNLGLVHLHTAQYASAFHYLSSSINLKPDFPSSYQYLAICLARLDDVDNAIAAYEKAVSAESDHLFHANFAITCWLHGRKEKAMEQFSTCQQLMQGMTEQQRQADSDVNEMMIQLERLMAKDPDTARYITAAAPAAAAPVSGSKGKRELSS